MSIEDFIDQTTEAQALKRALAVKLKESGEAVKEIEQLLGVKQNFVYKWCGIYKSSGGDASCFALGYKGSVGYLTSEQQEQLLEFLRDQDYYSVKELRQYIKTHYGVEYQSEQSYYDLLKAGGLSWKKTQKYNPKYDEQAAAERVEEIKKNWNRNGKT